MCVWVSGSQGEGKSLCVWEVRAYALRVCGVYKERGWDLTSWEERVRFCGVLVPAQKTEEGIVVVGNCSRCRIDTQISTCKMLTN